MKEWFTVFRVGRLQDQRSGVTVYLTLEDLGTALRDLRLMRRAYKLRDLEFRMATDQEISDSPLHHGLGDGRSVLMWEFEP